MLSILSPSCAASSPLMRELLSNSELQRLVREIDSGSSDSARVERLEALLDSNFFFTNFVHQLLVITGVRKADDSFISASASSSFSSTPSSSVLADISRAAGLDSSGSDVDERMLSSLFPATFGQQSDTMANLSTVLAAALARNE